MMKALLLLLAVTLSAAAGDDEGTDRHPAPEVWSVKCPPDWELYQGSCYLYVGKVLSWRSAESFCTSRGASLASVSDYFEYTLLELLLRRTTSLAAWIGGFHFQEWRWTDGSPFIYENWYSENNSTSSPCVYLHISRGWVSDVCSTGRPFICKSRICSY